MNKKDKAAYHRAYYEAHKEKNKAYLEAHKKERAIYNKAYHKAHKEERIAYKKAHRLQKRYGITLEDKRNMWREQNGRCVICRKKLTKSRDCHVDHCHVTGKIRGLLCCKCNTMLGNASDNPEILQNAINYLKANDEK